MKDFIDVAKRRGFFWASSTIHGGLSGFYDYGHLGSAVKRNWENLWRGFFLGLGDDFFEIQPSVIMPEAVFKASGHLEHFVDPVVKCKKCGNVERADHIMESFLGENFEGMTPEELTALINKHKVKCSKCKGSLEKAGVFNMLFPLKVGAGEASAKAYLTGETAQGVYTNFKQMFEVCRRRLPLGLAVIGKAFRNEIAPRNALIRMREFTQAELQIFFNPDLIEEHPKFRKVEKYKLRLLPVKNRKSKRVAEITCKDVTSKMKLPRFYVYHMAKVQEFYLDVLKIPKEKFRLRELSEEERAFYNKYHWDVEVEVGLGWTECGGVHYRTDHDLSGHQKVSGQSMEAAVEGGKVLPHVLELSFGVDRNVYSLLDIFYREGKDRVYLSLPPALAPYQAVVLPLVKKDGLPAKARDVYEMLKEAGIRVRYDEEYIGKAYYRQDEIGSVFCITFDYDSLKDKATTIRFRDNKKQIRVKIEDLVDVLNKLISGEIKFEKAGKKV
jgi:glycyl-tRNA synthetase